MRLFDAELVRRVASAVPLDVLVCTDLTLARASIPAFLEVHLLDPGQPRQRPDRIGPEDPVVHVDPVDEMLERLASELSGRSVLWVLGAESDGAALGEVEPGWVLLRAGTPLAEDSRLSSDPERLIDLGGSLLVGPPRLAEIVGESLGAGAVASANGGPPGAAGAAEGREPRSVEELEAALVRSEEAIVSLRATNQRLTARIAAMEPGPFARILHPFKKISTRLRPVLGVRLGLLWHHHPREIKLRRGYARTEPPADAPGISIVVPSFNQSAFIGATLDSILDQGYPNLQLIVQDGGSTDSTLEVLEGYRDRISHLESGPDGGQAPAINKGFARSTGEIMAWLNSDDILLPGSLAYVGRYFDENPDVDVVYGHRILIDSDGMEIGRWTLPAHDPEILSWADFVPQETMFWRREVFERAGGGLDEDFRFALDWDLLLRMREAGAKIVRVPRYIGAFRVHEEQKTNVQVGTVGGGEMDRLRRRVHGRRVDAFEVRKAIRRYRRRQLIIDKLQRLGVVRH